MDFDFLYKTYTIKELRDWLVHNQNNGLSDSIISRSRAFAFINNPHAKQEDVVLAVIFDESGDLVGYTGAYPEEWVRPNVPCRYFWGSTQWVNAKYRGKGVAWNMMRQIKDAVEDKYIALDSSIASCRLDEKQGYDISYYPRYFFVTHSNSSSVKGFFKNFYVSYQNKRVVNKLTDIEYIDRHISFIDNNTYSFIKDHSHKDLFLRKQDYLNWQIRYPFLQPDNCDIKTEKDNCEFGGYAHRVQILPVSVSFDGQIVGFYVLNVFNDICSVWYLYYEEKFFDKVCASLINNFMKITGVSKFRTLSKELFGFMRDKGFKSVFSKSNIEQISLTIPKGFIIDKSLHIQGGDGDML